MIYKLDLIKNGKLHDALSELTGDIDGYVLEAKGSSAVIGAFDPEKSRIYTSTDLGPALEALGLKVTGRKWDTLNVFTVSLASKKSTSKKVNNENDK